MEETYWKRSGLAIGGLIFPEVARLFGQSIVIYRKLPSCQVIRGLGAFVVLRQVRKAIFCCKIRSFCSAQFADVAKIQGRFC
jgi:hypothetical protein